jgi:hypothetical protein
MGNYPGSEALFPYGFGLNYSTSNTQQNIPGADICVSPNPANDYLSIRCSDGGKVSFQVIDVFGNLVIPPASFSNHEIQLPVKQLKSGFYILQISGDNWFEFVTFVKG